MCDRSVDARASRFEPAFRLNLEQQRKRAKELHRAFLAGDADAGRRFPRLHRIRLATPTSGAAD